MESEYGKNRKYIVTQENTAIWNIKARVYDSTFELSYPADVDYKSWGLNIILN